MRASDAPAVSAAEAPPILKLCVFIFNAVGKASRKMSKKVRLVNNCPFERINNGPSVFCLKFRKMRIAVTGHRWLLVAAILIVVPERKGSVLLAFITRNIKVKSQLKETSDRSKCSAGSNLDLEGQVYSEILSRPKKAVKEAAIKRYLSCCEKLERHKKVEIEPK